MDRRKFLASAVTAGTALSMTSTSATTQDEKPIRVVGVACSSRAGKTTATAVKIALEAAEDADDRIQTELLDLGGLSISGWVGGSKPSEAKLPDDDTNQKLQRNKKYP